MLSSPIEEQIEQFVRIDFLASNNEVEYKAMIIDLDLALTLTTSKVEVRSDWLGRFNENMRPKTKAWPTTSLVWKSI